jgi:hypothetical protein
MFRSVVWQSVHRQSGGNALGFALTITKLYEVTMPHGGQSLTHLLVHAIFSTKDRRPFLRSEEILDEIYAYKKFSYQEEIRKIFNHHRVAFEKRYVWD